MRRIGLVLTAMSLLVIAAVGSAGAFGVDDQDDVPPGAPLLDIVQNDDVIVEGSLCVSDDNECVNGEIFTIGPSTGFEIFVKDNVPRIGFVDIDSNQDDWVLQTSGASERFEIRSYDGATFDTPFRIESRSGNDLLYLDDTYRVGVGTQFPEAQLDVFSSSGAAHLTVREEVATDERRTLLTLQNNGEPSFVMSNAADLVDWELRLNPNNNFQINQPASPVSLTLGNAGGVVVKNSNGEKPLQLFAAGNLRIKGALTQNSDVNSKHEIVAVDTASVLHKVRDLPIAEWSYDFEDVRHVGPMAQDFHAAFGLGEGATSIATIDTSGVALAAIQELAVENEALRLANTNLEARLSALELDGANSSVGTPLPWALAALMVAGAFFVWRTRKGETLA